MTTMNEFRQMLTDEIVKLRHNKTTPAAINAICNATGKFLSTIRLEMEYAKTLGKTANIKMLNEVPTTNGKKLK